MQIYRIRQARKSFTPPEENWISFSGPDSIVLDAIANLGSVALNNPGPIGDRRALKGRGGSSSNSSSSSSSSSTSSSCQNLQSRSLVSIPCGRPIPANNFPVIVWTEQHNVSNRIVHMRCFGNDGHPSDNLCRPWGVAARMERSFEDSAHKAPDMVSSIAPLELLSMHVAESSSPTKTITEFRLV